MFISVEGADYSGKSTMCEVIREYFTARGREVVLTREPGGTLMGAMIRSILVNEDVINDPLSAIEQAMLLYVGRIHHINTVIVPALEAGKVVVSDRFMDSSLVYQGRVFKQSKFIESLVSIPEIAYLQVRPDYTIYFDIDYETMITRMSKRGDQNALDVKYAKLKELPLDCFKQHFYELQKSLGKRIQIIDSNGSIESVETATLAVCSEIADTMEKMLQRNWPLHDTYLARRETAMAVHKRK